MEVEGAKILSVSDLKKESTFLNTEQSQYIQWTMLSDTFWAATLWVMG